MNMNSRSLWVRYDGLFESDLKVCDIREQVQHQSLDKKNILLQGNRLRSRPLFVSSQTVIIHFESLIILPMNKYLFEQN